MGRAAVRLAVKDYFANAGLTYVGTVHEARPAILQEQDYETSLFSEAVASEHGSSAVLVVNIPQDHRQRKADTGRGAVNDQWLHKIVMEVFFASVEGAAIDAQKDYDIVVDGMTDLVRANATMNSGAIWSAGEYEAGVEHQQGEPFTDSDGTTVFIFGQVAFDAYEWVAGPVAT
jgi:hypothetical protein